MLLREIIYQDVFDSSKPVRLEADDQICTLRLGPDLDPQDVQDLVLSTLYPRQTPQRLRMALAGAQEAKVAAVFEHRERSYRILRRADSESLRLQVKETAGWRDLAAGSSAVDERLAQTMSRPDFETFWALNLWRFERSPREATTFDVDALDPKVRNVALKYRVAMSVEAVEDELKATEAKIEELSKELGQGAALEEKLRKAKAKLVELEVSELSEEDLDLLKRRDQLLGEFEHQLQRLEEQEDGERHQIDMLLPDKPHRTAIFWAGLVIAIGSIVWSAVDPAMRAVALADIIGFGMVAWVLFNYFDGMERASLHQVRLESIKRRLNQVREEQVSTQERINHVLIHAGVRDAKEMSERVAKTEQLSGIIQKMEKKVEELRSDAGYMEALEKMDVLKERLEELEAERRELPEDTLSSFQLESDLETLGVDPQLVLDEPSSAADEDDGATPLDRLIAAAEATGQWDGIEVFPTTRKMWGKICGHVLGEKFTNVSLTSEGRIRIGELDAEQVAMWMKTRPSEHEVVLRAFALAIQVGADERSRRGVFESIIIADPSEYLTAVQVSKLQEVFKSAAEKSSIVILEGR